MTTQWTRRFIYCITVLLVIATISGGLLAILNDVLYVSSEERTSRALKKIYGEEKTYTVLLDTDNEDSPIEYDFGKIDKVFIVGDDTSDSYDYLFKSTGYQGYKNGTITVWTQVAFDKTADKYSIVKVVMEEYTKQTLMSKLGSSFYSNFELVDVTKAYEDGEDFSPIKGEGMENIVSGATKSAVAGCNAVNCVLKYVGEVLK